MTAEYCADYGCVNNFNGSCSVTACTRRNPGTSSGSGQTYTIKIPAEPPKMIRQVELTEDCIMAIAEAVAERMKRGNADDQ